MEKTLQDFSKAFDRVWKEDLLLRAVDKVLPLTFANCLLDFLSNCQASVQINAEQGRPVPPKQGLPQGSVLSPLLFLLYINDLKTVVPIGVEVAMFADDVALFCSHPCILTAQTAMQEAVTRVAEWSRQHKMTLNTEMCEVAFLQVTCTRPDWQLTIYLEGQPLRFTPLPKLLEVTLDRALSFGQHTANITAKAAGRCHVLISLSSNQWVWRKDQLTQIYKALYLSVMMYEVPAWQPWLSATRLEQLDRCQNRALRVITGQLQTTPVETLRREAGV